jgi:hypothetical protein
MCDRWLVTGVWCSPALSVIMLHTCALNGVHRLWGGCPFFTACWQVVEQQPLPAMLSTFDSVDSAQRSYWGPAVPPGAAAVTAVVTGQWGWSDSTWS